MKVRARERLNVLRWLATSRARALATRLYAVALPVGALTFLLWLAALERVRTIWRRARGARPRLIWGPVPIISIKYWSAAMRQRGYESRTCVSVVYPINERADFDVHRDEFVRLGPGSVSLTDYAMFAWVLRRGDVFPRFLDGGFLRDTALGSWETRLLRLAGKKIVVSPYGGDIAVTGHLGDLEVPLLADYPALPDQRDVIERRVLDSLREADVSIRNWQFGYQPAFDVVWLTQLAIDTEQWDATGHYSDSDGRDGEVVIVHAPNHRRIKGTEHFERAVAELREEGLQVELRILERRPNEEIRAAIKAADIVGDQLLAGYAMYAVEGMAAGKPVVSNLSSIPAEVRDSAAFRVCPIVDSDPGQVLDDLRRLIQNPALRRKLGRAGREFVLRYHSYDAVADEWEAILSHAWRGTPIPERLRPMGVSRAR